MLLRGGRYSIACRSVRIYAEKHGERAWMLHWEDGRDAQHQDKSQREVPDGKGGRPWYMICAITMDRVHVNEIDN